MNKALYSLFIVASFFIFTISCDKVDDPIPPNIDIVDTSIIWDDSVFSKTNNGIRYVLMEEFTGHTCTNCPAAATEVDRLRNKKYGEKFIPIAMHATEPFAAPKAWPGAPGGSYQSDHRTDESLDYENEPLFGILKGNLSSFSGDSTRVCSIVICVSNCPNSL